MKIAVVTDDGQTISRHFGRAALYAVVTVVDGAVVARELRPKSAPHRQPDGHANEPAEDHTGPAARDKHLAMVGPIGDCSWVVAGGMGRGAYTHITAAGLRPGSPRCTPSTRRRSSAPRDGSSTTWSCSIERGGRHERG